MKRLFLWLYRQTTRKIKFDIVAEDDYYGQTKIEAELNSRVLLKNREVNILDWMLEEAPGYIEYFAIKPVHPWLDTVARFATRKRNEIALDIQNRMFSAMFQGIAQAHQELQGE